MLSNYVKIAFRNLWKHKTFSIINILGFAFSISICLMIALFIIHEYSYDKYNEKLDRIYRLIDAKDNVNVIDYRTAKLGLDNFPQIEDACIVQTNSSNVGITYEDNGHLLKNIMSTESSFFRIFTTKFISGDKRNALPELNSCVLTKSAAREIFGTENPIGKEIILWNIHPLIVNGVIEDFPENSSIQADIFVNSEKKEFKFSFSCEDCNDVTTHRYPFNVYFLLGNNVNAAQLENNLNKHAEVFHPYIKNISLLPLEHKYLYDISEGWDNIKGNLALLMLLLNIAVIILILSIINYVNLTAAQQNQRNKETGIRKTVGASRRDMILLFLSESVFITSLSFMAALAILELALPFFNSIIDKNLNSAPLFKFPAVIIIPAAVLVLGLLAGLGPALILSSFNPIRIFNGGLFTQRSKSRYRNILTVFQFSVSICLIFCIIVIQKQMSLVKHKDLGFEKEQTLFLEFPAFQPSDSLKASTLMNELRRYPDIRHISGAQGSPGSINFIMGSGVPGKDKSVSCIYVDSSFLKTFNIPVVKGRDFLPGDKGLACIMNETAYKYYEWEDLNNKRFNNGREGGFEVVGIVRDFNFSSLHQPIEPLCLLYTNFTPSKINLKIAGHNISRTMNYIQKTWKEIAPSYPINYQFYDEMFDAMYRKEEKLGELIGLFGALAIVISCLGILGLAIFSSERRAKEIGIRKVHGASVPELIFMLNKDFIKLVGISFLIAAPSGFFLMSAWLSDFAYKAGIDWSVFFLSGFFALAIALLTINWQIWRTTTRNPVEVLKYE